MDPKEKEGKIIFFISAILIAVFGVAAPVTAVTDTVTVAGEILEISADDALATVRVTNVWNGESWVGVSVRFISREMVTGHYPKSFYGGEISEGDFVHATFTGDAGEIVEWVTFSKVLAHGTGKYISDSYGDPSYLISRFSGNFKMSYETYPDCSDCNAQVCSAVSSNVKVSQGWEEKNYNQIYSMMPGERRVFTSPEGSEQELMVTFVSGQAGRENCAGYGETTGSQPFSDFKISVIQKGTGSDITFTPTPSPEKTVPIKTEIPATPTQESPGFIWVTTLAALFCIAAVLKKRGL